MAGAPAPNFANRTMWTRDNLDVLRGLNDECIDLVYADPPFNSNKNYEAPIGSKAAGAAFKDTWTLSDIDLAWHGEIAEREPKVYAAIDNAGIVHGKGMKSYLIMMAVRLLELRRVLKPRGSLYLHCDDVADTYLRVLADSVFGATAFRNAITWKRTTAHSDGGRFGRNTDTLLFYKRTDRSTWNEQFTPYTAEYRKRFRFHDADGRAWQDGDLTAKGLSGGGYQYEYKGRESLWRVPIPTMERLDAEGRLHFTKGNSIRLKKYLDELPGQRVQVLWDDINPINSQSTERTGYPTQKPLALLDRIIKASSNEGDVVLDPFCGCATACVSAEALGRQWIGIDLSPVAATLVESRLREQFGIFAEVHHRTDVPRRTDLGELPNYRTHKHELFGVQEGHCGGCNQVFDFRQFEVDHVIPRAKGGSDHRENLQLLCPACNRLKGTRSQAELIAKLRERRLLAA